MPSTKPTTGTRALPARGITRRALGALAGDLGFVIDPFCGSGATLAVAKERGIRAIGIEKSEKWAEVAAKRAGNTTPALI
jgi:tRNA G10  N-methylase Trm11